MSSAQLRPPIGRTGKEGLNPEDPVATAARVPDAEELAPGDRLERQSTVGAGHAAGQFDGPDLETDAAGEAMGLAGRGDDLVADAIEGGASAGW